MKIRNQNPKGGTELQFEYLNKHVETSLLNQVEICTSVPEKKTITSNKDKYTLAKKILGINLTYIHGLVINLIIVNMIGMYLIHIGIMKN